MQDNAAMSLESFIDRLLEEKGLQNMEPAVLAEMKNDLLERVAERLNAEMIAALPQDKIAEVTQRKFACSLNRTYRISTTYSLRRC